MKKQHNCHNISRTIWIEWRIYFNNYLLLYNIFYSYRSHALRGSVSGPLCGHWWTRSVRKMFPRRAWEQ